MLMLTLALQIGAAAPAPDTAQIRAALRVAVEQVAAAERPKPGATPLFLDLATFTRAATAAGMPSGSLSALPGEIGPQASNAVGDSVRVRSATNGNGVRDDGMLLSLASIARTDSMLTIEFTTERNAAFEGGTWIVKRGWQATLRREGEQYAFVATRLLWTP